MTKSGRRPFYAEYAWAFDLLIERPVHEECAVIASWLAEHGVVPGATLLDAGCGSGRYAAELARRGYIVHGVDLSPELVARATQLITERGMLSFAVGDILTLPTAGYDAILCRGVLNDLLADDERESAVAAFARALRPAGVLILDVREWEASAERKSREPVFSKTVSTDRGTLTFTSVTEIDTKKRCLLLSERHTLRNDDHEQVRDYQFVMRCWTRDELETVFRGNGFSRVRYFGAYVAHGSHGGHARPVRGFDDAAGGVASCGPVRATDRTDDTDSVSVSLGSDPYSTREFRASPAGRRPASYHIHGRAADNTSPVESFNWSTYRELPDLHVLLPVLVCGRELLDLTWVETQSKSCFLHRTDRAIASATTPRMTPSASQGSVTSTTAQRPKPP